jgi:hypothetical protein
MTYLSVVLGLISALAAGLVAARIAASAGRRPASVFGICGFVLGLLVYGGVLQTLVLYVHPTAVAAAIGPETVFLGFTGAACLSAVAAGAGVVLAWIALVRTGERPAGRLKTTGFALLFTLAAAILAAPFLIHNQITIEQSIEANEAEINAFSTSYKSGLDKLTRIGALSRIEVDDTAVTHYVGGPLYKIGEKGLAEYARAAMIYHTRVLGHAPVPVVLRDTETEARIGTFRTDGVFVVHMASIPPQAAVTHDAPVVR